MAKIVTLKDNNDGIVYPITPVDGVFVDSNTTLADALDDKVETDLSNLASNSISASKIDLSNLLPAIFQTGRMPVIDYTTVPSAWTPTNIGSSVTINNLEPTGKYAIIGSTSYTESAGGEFRLVATGSNTTTWVSYNSDDNLIALSFFLRESSPTAQGSITLQRKYSGDIGQQVRAGVLDFIIIRTA